MENRCAWCGEEMEKTEGGASFDTCDKCDDYLEENIDGVIETFNRLLEENEAKSPKSKKDKEEAAKVSYSLINAIQFFQGEPAILFRDSKFAKNLPESL